MYTRILHNITEEHHGIWPPAQGSIGSPELPILVINEATMVFRMDSRTLWTRYVFGLINLSVALRADFANAKQVESRLFKYAANIGEYFVPYYGATAGYRIGGMLNTYVRIGIDTIQSVKDGKSLSSVEPSWIAPIEELAKYLHELNPTQYPVELLTDMFKNLATYWTDNIIARFGDDDSADQISIDNINKLVITGIPNHINKGYQSIADVLSRGVIAQFPLAFVES